MKNLLFALLIVFIITSCEKKQDPFLIEKHNVGSLTDSTQVKDLESIYLNDSIVKFVGGDEFTGNINNIDIYDKNGNHLLILTPDEALDSTAVIDNIRIMDSRFKTAKNISTLSTFKDILKCFVINVKNTSDVINRIFSALYIKVAF